MKLYYFYQIYKNQFKKHVGAVLTLKLLGEGVTFFARLSFFAFKHLSVNIYHIVQCVPINMGIQ